MLINIIKSNISKFFKFKTLNIQKVVYVNTFNDVPKNLLEDYITAHKQKDNGYVYDKKPFRIELVAGKTYFWCLCGKSKNQPFCDGTHKDVFLKIKQRPIKFEVAETKLYWLCQCKHTSQRPFCDGTHKSKVVQDAPSTIKQ